MSFVYNKGFKPLHTNELMPFKYNKLISHAKTTNYGDYIGIMVNLEMAVLKKLFTPVRSKEEMSLFN